jgi:ferrous iron transport protein B
MTGHYYFCASTLAVIRRETESWSWMAITFASMFALAYAASLATHTIAHALGAGSSFFNPNRTA